MGFGAYREPNPSAPWRRAPPAPGPAALLRGVRARGGGLGTWGLGFRELEGFRGLGFRFWGFLSKGFRVSRSLGVYG